MNNNEQITPPEEKMQQWWEESDQRADRDDPQTYYDYIATQAARWGNPTPQPVPVSERLPGPKDCLDEGWAWFFNQRIGWRQEVLPVNAGYTHWLPAHALPTPGDSQ
jgi:hypothetical protein